MPRWDFACVMKKSINFCPPWILQNLMAQMGSLLEHWNTLLQASLLRLRNCLICLCMRMGHIPSEWKQSLVVPIPNSNNNKGSPNNYRPISLLMCSASYWKGMWTKYLLNIFAHTTPCLTHSGGSLQGNQLYSPIDNHSWTFQQLEEGKEICAVVFDFKKAFDTTKLQQI